MLHSPCVSTTIIADKTTVSWTCTLLSEALFIQEETVWIRLKKYEEKLLLTSQVSLFEASIHLVADTKFEESFSKPKRARSVTKLFPDRNECMLVLQQSRTFRIFD